MRFALRSSLLRVATLLAFAAAPFLTSCSNSTVDPNPVTTPPTSGTTTPGSGTTTPGSGTTTPGSGTTTPGATVFPTVTFINQKDNLNLLEAAIARAGLVDEFNKSGITVFAPSDDAFRTAGYADAAAINSASPSDLQRILRYHVVGSRIDQSAIPTAVNTSYQSTLADNRIAVYKASMSDIRVNNGQIIQGDNPTVGSVVHIINTVLKPASTNLVALAKANTNLSLFGAAYDRANASTQALLNSATENGLTVFAPTNDAFKAAGYADAAAIQKADQAVISDLLLYHVLKYQAYSQTFQNGADVVTAQGTSLRTNVASGKVTLLGKGNGTNVANITQADQSASNGVLQVIDRVLLPK
ncbi:fasciclin domain-containing protein [Spirosoma luteolum]